MNKEDITRIVHKIRGNPELIDDNASLVSEFSLSDWLYLLDHLPNEERIVAKCNQWSRFAIDDLCDLLCAHSQLVNRVPQEVLERFKGGHWARMITADHSLGAKLEALDASKELYRGWCCVYHWAENYVTCFNVASKCPAAQSDAGRVAKIARESAINPRLKGPGCKIDHATWLRSIADDCEGMAEIADARKAEEYRLIAQAANTQGRSCT